MQMLKNGKQKEEKYFLRLPPINCLLTCCWTFETRLNNPSANSIYPNYCNQNSDDFLITLPLVVKEIFGECNYVIFWTSCFLRLSFFITIYDREVGGKNEILLSHVMRTTEVKRIKHTHTMRRLIIAWIVYEFKTNISRNNL